MSFFFRLYLKGACSACSLTAVSNVFLSNLIDNPPINMTKEPKHFFSTLVEKSFMSGLLWPITPIKVFHNPEHFLIVGHQNNK